MLGNNKNVFWEALLLASIIFILGIFIGVAFEAKRVNEISSLYDKSSISLTDSLALRELVSSGDFSCDEVVEYNLNFADDVYEEARLLEEYDSAEKITNGLMNAHRRYDLLRTLLWINLREIRDSGCTDFDYLIYVYNYNVEDLDKKATQEVWSKVLRDLKEERGGDLILVPVAGDSNLTSFDVMLSRLNISKSELPVVIVNDKFIIRNISSSEDVEDYL